MFFGKALTYRLAGDPAEPSAERPDRVEGSVSRMDPARNVWL